VIGTVVAATVAVATVSPPTIVTPMNERIVHLAALNKRNGQTQEFSVRPGETFRFATLTVSVRACETTPAWEARQTAAYLRIDDVPVQVRTSSVQRARRVFSGWMFAESPSLNPLEHPLYDVWVRSCTMRFPDTGPDTVVAGRSATSQSNAAKSPAAPSAAASKPM
jgi:hypothetical protein